MSGFTGPRPFAAAVLFPGLDGDEIRILQASLSSGWAKQDVLCRRRPGGRWEPLFWDTSELLADCSAALRQVMADGRAGA